MTPFFKANPALAYLKNNDNESPQDLLNAGKLKAEKAAQEMKEAEDQREEVLAAREKKAKEDAELKMKELEFAEKLQNANDEDNAGEDILFQQTEWLKEEIKGNLKSLQWQVSTLIFQKLSTIGPTESLVNTPRKENALTGRIFPERAPNELPRVVLAPIREEKKEEGTEKNARDLSISTTRNDELTITLGRR